MEEAISNSIRELSIIIEPEPELSQVTEETIVTDNNTENNTVEQKHFGPLIVICKDLTQEKEEKTNSDSEGKTRAWRICALSKRVLDTTHYPSECTRDSEEYRG